MWKKRKHIPCQIQTSFDILSFKNTSFFSSKKSKINCAAMLAISTVKHTEYNFVVITFKILFGSNWHCFCHFHKEFLIVSSSKSFDFQWKCFSMPGDFVMVEPIAEGDKVKAEITHILYKEQVKYIREEGKWYVILHWNLQLKRSFCGRYQKVIDHDWVQDEYRRKAFLIYKEQEHQSYIRLLCHLFL